MLGARVREVEYSPALPATELQGTTPILQILKFNSHPLDRRKKQTNKLTNSIINNSCKKCHKLQNIFIMPSAANYKQFFG